MDLAVPNEQSNLVNAIKRWQRQRKSVCLTISGKFTGGLDNTVAMVNHAMQFAMYYDVKFGMPKIMPPAHGVGNDFADMFAGAAEDCRENVEAWTARCPLDNPKEIRRTIIGGLSGGRCQAAQMVLATESEKVRVQMCGCDVLALLEARRMSWTNHYMKTRTVFQDAYWATQQPVRRTSTYPLQLSFHVRLGDAKARNLHSDKNGSRYTPVGVYLNMIDALAAQLDPRCFEVSIFSDGSKEDDVELLQVRDKWRDVRPSKVRIHDKRTSAVDTLSSMTHADVTMAGNSGFSRLAAVLGHAKVGLFIDECSEEKFPVDWIPGITTVLRLEALNRPDAFTVALGKNENFQELAENCKTYVR